MLPLLAAAVVALAPLPAHATVLETNPAEGETVTAAVDAFSVTVNEDILDVGGVDTANGITITDADGAFYGDGCALVDGPTLSMPATLGEPGTYTMSYSLVSADGHTIGDDVTFEWAPDGDVEAAEGAAAAPECASDDATSDEASQGSDDADADASAPAASDEGEQPADDGSAPLVILGIVGVVIVAGIVIGVLRKGIRKQ